MLDVAVFSAKSYDEASFAKVNKQYGFELHFHEFQLTNCLLYTSDAADDC